MSGVGRGAEGGERRVKQVWAEVRWGVKVWLVWRGSGRA